MLDLQSLIEDGIILEKEFNRLDDHIVNERYLEGNTDARAARIAFKILKSDIESFISRVQEFIKDARKYTNSSLLYSKNRQNVEKLDELCVDAPKMAECYICGKTVKQLLQQLDNILKGLPEKFKTNCRFIYVTEHKKIYENKIGNAEFVKITSRDMKNETICEVLFKKNNRFKYINDESIENKRMDKFKKKYKDFNDSEERSPNPYQWIKDSCRLLNKHVSEKFNIKYKLFETDPTNYSIRLNPMARVDKNPKK